MSDSHGGTKKRLSCSFLKFRVKHCSLLKRCLVEKRALARFQRANYRLKTWQARSKHVNLPYRRWKLPYRRWKLPDRKMKTTWSKDENYRINIPYVLLTAYNKWCYLWVCTRVVHKILGNKRFDTSLPKSSRLSLQKVMTTMSALARIVITLVKPAQRQCH